MTDLDRPAVARSRRRRLLRAAVACVVAAPLVALAPVAIVRIGVAGHLHDDVTAVPDAPVAIVLGAGLTPAGDPGPFLAQRIAVAAELYRLGTVRALLMSGDNSQTDYDEVSVMAAEARRLGVPASAVVTDHAGFDTYSSCYRARSVWGIEKAVVVTQPFHLPRAVWTCRRLGVEAVGAATASMAVVATRAGWVREIPATDKAVLDWLRGREPRFTGPRETTLDGVT